MIESDSTEITQQDQINISFIEHFVKLGTQHNKLAAICSMNNSERMVCTDFVMAPFELTDPTDLSRHSALLSSGYNYVKSNPDASTYVIFTHTGGKFWSHFNRTLYYKNPIYISATIV